MATKAPSLPTLCETTITITEIRNSATGTIALATDRDGLAYSFKVLPGAQAPSIGKSYIVKLVPVV